MKYFMSENTTRKVDALGRVSIPKSLRDRLDIQSEDEMAFYMMEYQDKRYIAMCNTKENMDEVALKYKTAIDVLEELNIDLPAALIEAYNEHAE